MNWLLSRLKEPSTWAGLAGLIPTAAAVMTEPLTSQAIGAMVAGVAAVLMKEQGHA